MNNRADGIRSSAFPTLADDQIEFLRRYREVRKIEPGQACEGGGHQFESAYEGRKKARRGSMEADSMRLARGL
jgi:hypothetical protein